MRQKTVLTTTEIHLLGDIVTRAAQYPLESCTYALTTAYRATLAERGIDPNHDKVIFNWVNAISKRCAKVKLEEGHVVFLDELRNVCQSQGITLLDLDNCADAESKPHREHDSPDSQSRKQKTDRRRVSFDEARYEETQLSEHSEIFQDQTPDVKAYLGRPPTPGHPFYNQRAHSADADGSHRVTSKKIKHAYDASLNVSEPDGPADSSILIHSALSDEERDAQLQDTVDAFHEMSDLRLIRRCIHTLHDAFIAQRSRDEADELRAAAHDGRTLLRQALDLWIGAVQVRARSRKQEEEFERMERRAGLYRGLMIAQKSFDHWYRLHLRRKEKTEEANKLVLAMRYFRRWRGITEENNSKVRQIPLRKFLGRWQDGAIRRQVCYEQAAAHYEESLEQRYFNGWKRQLCERKAEDLYQERNARRALRKLSDRLHRLQDMSQEAQTLRSRRPLDAVMQTLRSNLQERQDANAAAQAHYEQKSQSNHMQTLVIQGRLRPLEKTMSLRVTLTLQRKAFSVWHLRLSLTRQAAQVDRKRVLQDAWTSWNDTLRTRALAQRMDERVLVENLYRWVLQGRLNLFRRTADARLARHALLQLHEAVDDYRSTLDRRVEIFAENQRRRKLASSMVHLNLALRRQEDADRKAVEFVNSRALPDVLGQWKVKSEHSRKLAKMAADARWYCLASSALKTWRTCTTEHQHQRRRDAYVQIRARVKYKLASKCFTTWRTKGMEVRSMEEESQRRAQARLFATGIRAFDQWREATGVQREHEMQAASIDNQRLLVSAFAAMMSRHTEDVTIEQRATSFRLETDLALQASALKRIQWAAFTISQQTNTADALLARNFDKHFRNMFRHWFTKASTSRAARTAKVDETAEPESPSIRSASRAAARSASRERFTPSHSTSYTPGTPGYMRTPSRSRRAGRFRPIPTPGAVTPFAFDPGYLATTPAPFAAAASNSPMLPAGLTPQVTPFARKLRAGGFVEMPPSALRGSVFGRSTSGVGTGKSVRFAGAGRFAKGTPGRREIEEDGEQEGHFKSS
jgi:protein SFI1